MLELTSKSTASVCLGTDAGMMAWCLKGSKGCSGHIPQGGEVSSPSHHLMAIWCLLGSRLRPRPGDGTAESHAEAWGEDTDRRRALSAVVLSVRRELN